MVGEALGVDLKALDKFIDEGCALINQRFTEGPARPYADKSIAELVKILDENYDKGEPKASLKPPADNADLEELQDRLLHPHDGGAPIRLPEDYEEFLRTTDGFYPGEDFASQESIFYGTAGIERDELGESFLEVLEFEIFPYAYTIIADETFDNIKLPDAIRTFSIEAGGDEGYIWLIEPESVKEVLEVFEAKYKGASERDKRMYERAALGLYGGLERLRGLEWLVVACYHWSPTERIFRYVKTYLRSRQR